MRPAQWTAIGCSSVRVFILSSVRSGSTLLRVMLDTHSQLHAPHELHLIGLGVTLDGRHVATAMSELGADSDHLEYLLWDRLLHREMVRHGKTRLVNKTPSDTLMWRRIVECWPDAQFIYLQRHPAAVTDSWNRNRAQWTRERTAEDVRRYMTAMELARIERPGLTVRYEELTREPERQLRRICVVLWVCRSSHGHALNYGQGDHGRYLPWPRRLERADQGRQDSARTPAAERGRDPAGAARDQPSLGLRQLTRDAFVGW